MSVGKEYLKVLHEALAGFEEAVKARENPGMLASRVSLQQDVDKARERIIDTVVNIVTQDRLARAP